jgi:hypothetical protein
VDNHLIVLNFLSGYAAFTVTSTAKNFRLRAIDGDRSRWPQLEHPNPGALTPFGRNADAFFDDMVHLF